ncbi:MAG TPA: alkaline phosphatase family protein [Stellaceae bacterium]|jgi:phospholipase C
MKSLSRLLLVGLAAGTCLTPVFSTATRADGLESFFGGQTDGIRTKTPIKHLVVIFQENETFDHYFGTYPNAVNDGVGPNFRAKDDTPGVNGYSPELLNNNPNRNKNGGHANPFRLVGPAQAITCSQNHNYTPEQQAVDGGLLDKFPQSVDKGNGANGCVGDGSSVMAYFDGNTVTALWNYAQHFAMSDNAFGTNFGPSTPGAINLVSGETFGMKIFPSSANNASYFPAAPGMADATLIGDIDPLNDACSIKTPQGQMDASLKNVGDLLNAPPSGKPITWGWFNGGFKAINANPVSGTTPCVNQANGGIPAPGLSGGHPSNALAYNQAAAAQHATVPALLNISPNAGQTLLQTVETVEPDYVAHHAPFMYYPTTANLQHVRPSPDTAQEIGKSDQAHHQYDLTDFYASIKARNLPAVSFLKAEAWQDGHPGIGDSDPIDEQAFIVQVVNALQESPQWVDTAVVVMWDDSDGWYDHVTGPIVNPSKTSVDNFVGPGNCGTPAPTATPARCGYGPRLPFLVISPWAKTNYVDHTLVDQTSVLRFIEENWNLDFIDGPATIVNGQRVEANSIPDGQGSFDRFAGPIDGMFDFDDAPNLRPLILNGDNGTIVTNFPGWF